MYQPAHFAVAERERSDRLARELIDAHPFATLVGVREGEPFVTHCPITAQPPPADVRPAAGGFVLEGHVARANPHWRDWTNGGASLLAIFRGPHAYVSPTLYAERRNVPTWNYVVVHVQGPVQVVDGADDKHALIKRLIARIEPAYAAQWDELGDDYHQRMLAGIVGFRITPARVDAKFKLSQNRLPVDRDGVRRAFDQGTPVERELADWMRRLMEN